jgi:hypothetical protein
MYYLRYAVRLGLGAKQGLRETAHAERAADLHAVRRRLLAFRDVVWHDAARECRRFEGAAEGDHLRFACDELLCNHVALATTFLSPIAKSDAAHLDQYLDGLQCRTQREIAAASTSADIAAAVVDAAEDLHSYLLGHEMVDRQYGLIQSFQSSQFRREPQPIDVDSVSSWQERARVAATVAESHEYTLAA